MLNFSTAMLLCGTIIYVGQQDFWTFIVMATLGTLFRVGSFSIELNNKNEKTDVKKSPKILHERIH